VPPTIRPLDPAVPECRLCQEFPTFSKPFEYHKHLADIHFRTELNNDLPQNNVSLFWAILLNMTFVLVASVGDPGDILLRIRIRPHGSVSGSNSIL
jgi:hypothetical protein